jgi:hypothetical protein
MQLGHVATAPPWEGRPVGATAGPSPLVDSARRPRHSDAICSGSGRTVAMGAMPNRRRGIGIEGIGGPQGVRLASST